MSYDLVFVKRDPGQTFDDALDALEEKEASEDEGLAPEVVTGWERIVRTAQELFGDQVSDSADERECRLIDAQEGLQVELSPGEYIVTLPHNHGEAEAAEALLSRAYQLARVIEQVTGTEGYDPQLDQAVASADPSRAATMLARTSVALGN